MIDAKKRFSVGIIGAGWVAGARHVPSYRKDGRVQLAAVYDPDLPKAERMARAYEIPRATDDLDELLDLSLDAVSVCTPPMSHAAVSVAALEAGRHVFVEKPMAMSTKEATAMVGAAEKAGRRLCVSHNFLFSRSMKRALRMLEDGSAGEVQHAIALQLSSPKRRLPAWYPELPGGLFFDESPHMLYILRRVLGDLLLDGAWSQPAPAGSAQPIERVDARFSAGRHSAQLTMSFAAPASEWLVLVVCERAVLVIDVFRDILSVLGSDNRHGTADVLKSSLGFLAQATAGFATSGALHATGRLYYGHDELITRFLDSIDGAETPVPLAESLAVLRTMERITQSWWPTRAEAA